MGVWDRTKKWFQPYNRAQPPPTPEVHQLGADGRESVDDPYEYWTESEFSETVRPGAVRRRLALNPIKTKNILNKCVSEIIEDFIDTNADLSFATRSYIDFSITDFELESDNDKSLRRIEGFISDMESGAETFLGFLQRVFYGVYVEGASSTELNWSKSKKRAISISYVPPFSLEFKRATDKEYGRYYKIVQYVGSDYRNPVVLQDRANPNHYYRYTPVNLSGTRPYGNSSLEPALWGAVGRSDLMGTLLGFIQGQITPKGVFSPDLASILSAGPNMNLTAPQILQYANEVAKVVKEASDKGKITQDLVSSFPILYQAVGATTEGVNFDPIETLNKTFAFGIQMGARLPSILFQPENLRSAIGDQKTRIDWTSFNDRCVTVGNVVTGDITKHFDMVLMGDRMMEYESYEPEVVLKIVRNDAEIRRMEAEALKLRMEAYSEVANIQVSGEPVFTGKEVRRMVVEGRTDFDDFLVERPEDEETETDDMETDDTAEEDMEDG